MLVLKTTSPPVSPVAPAALPRNTVPFSSASVAFNPELHRPLIRPLQTHPNPHAQTAARGERVACAPHRTRRMAEDRQLTAG
jgi:hypothetical protein